MLQCAEEYEGIDEDVESTFVDEHQQSEFSGTQNIVSHRLVFDLMIWFRTTLNLFWRIQWEHSKVHILKQ